MEEYNFVCCFTTLFDRLYNKWILPSLRWSHWVAALTPERWVYLSLPQSCPRCHHQCRFQTGRPWLRNKAQTKYRAPITPPKRSRRLRHRWINSRGEEQHPPHLLHPYLKTLRVVRRYDVIEGPSIHRPEKCWYNYRKWTKSPASGKVPRRDSRIDYRMWSGTGHCDRVIRSPREWQVVIYGSWRVWSKTILVRI